jgi:anti-repressor protein
MTNLKTFNFTPSLQLRAIDIDGEPWFMSADVCRVLGHTNPSTAVKSHVHDEDKQQFKCGLRGKPPTVVNEMGLYALILGSKKPDARVFKRWVTHEVLPTIRKTGGYMSPEMARLATEDPAVYMARSLIVAHESLLAAKSRLAIVEPQAVGMDPLRVNIRGVTTQTPMSRFIPSLDRTTG